MADIVKFQDVSLATPAPNYNDTLSGLHAFENLAVGDAVYIGTDGLVHLSGGSGATAGVAKGFVQWFVIGGVEGTVYAGQAVTLADNVRFHYAQSLVPGSLIYLSAVTPGGLATAAPYAGGVPIGHAIDAMKVHLRANWQIPV